MLFLGRKKELQDLSRVQLPALVAIKGRRRIGKSTLVEEFAKDKIFLSFSGVPPIDDTTAQDQRNTFTKQLGKYFPLPDQPFEDWTDAYHYLSDRLTNKPTVILFDEISWMGSKDHMFLPLMKNWWDLVLLKCPNVMLIFCGSVSTWIEENILNSTAFFGRINLEITLDELSIAESAQLLGDQGVKGSHYDIYKALSITGGVPWYIKAFSYHYLVDNNIQHLCFSKDGKFVTEFERIFHDLFNGHGSIYKKILHLLADGMKDLSEIRDKLNYAHSGSLSDYMHNLIVSGFVSQHHQWRLQTGQLGRSSLYRLRDNYIRFFIKYIEPNLRKIEQGVFQDIPITQLPGWESMMGFQVENLLLRNRSLLLQSLDINPISVVADNPYIQRKTSRQKGCQVDYLIQTDTRNLFVCEFKFQRRTINTSIIDEMKEKISRMYKPQNFGVVPVLFHLEGVTDEVHDARYFYRIVDISDFIDVVSFRT